MPIDFRLLDPARFEHMCGSLVRAENPRARAVDGRSGDEGLDSFADEIDEPGNHVYQYKYFTGLIRDTQKKEIRESLKTAIDKHSPSEWTLVVATDFDLNALRWWHGQEKKHPDIQMNLIAATELKHLLHKHTEIRQEYFPTTEDRFQALVRAAKDKPEILIEQDASILKSMSMQADVLNQDPDFDFSFTLSPDGMVIEARPRRPEAAARPVFSLSVESDDVTNLLTHQRALFGRGEAVVIDGRHIKGFESIFDRFRSGSGPIERLELVPQFPDERVPISLTVTDESGTETVPYLELRKVRAGTEEVLLDNTHDLEAPLGMRMKVDLVTRQVALTFQLRDIVGRRPSEVLPYLRIASKLIDGSVIEIAPLKHPGRPLKSEVSGPTIPLAPEKVVSLVEILARVEASLSPDLRLPDEISPKDIEAMQLIDRALKGETIRREGTLKVSLTPNDPQAVRQMSASGEVKTIYVRAQQEISLLGQTYEFPIGIHVDSLIRIVEESTDKQGKPIMKLSFEGEIESNYAHDRLSA